MAKLRDMKRRGIVEHGIAPVVYEVIATLPVIEAMRRSGAECEQVGEIWKITLGPQMPDGIVAVHLNQYPATGIRLEHEPSYPQEYADSWRQVDFTPCPVCLAPVVWYEAGYVPGYRVCTGKRHHHSLASN